MRGFVELAMDYQVDRVYSHLCLCFQDYSGRNQLGKVGEHWCLLDSSGLLDKYLQSHLILEKQTENPLDSSNLKE